MVNKVGEFQSRFETCSIYSHRRVPLPSPPTLHHVDSDGASGATFYSIFLYTCIICTRSTLTLQKNVYKSIQGYPYSNLNTFHIYIFKQCIPLYEVFCVQDSSVGITFETAKCKANSSPEIVSDFIAIIFCSKVFSKRNQILLVVYSRKQHLFRNNKKYKQGLTTIIFPPQPCNQIAL